MRGYCDADKDVEGLFVRIVIEVPFDEVGRMYAEEAGDGREPPSQDVLDRVCDDAAYDIGYLDTELPVVERMVARAVRDSCAKVRAQLEE